MEARKKACKMVHSEENTVTFRKWSDLPKPLLYKISTFVNLRSPFDKLSFLLVCKSWNTSVSTVTEHRILYHDLPRKLVRLPPCFLQHGKSFICFVSTCVFLLQPLNKPDIKPWLVYVEELKPGKLKIHCPFTKTTISNRDFPLNFPKRMDLSSFRVVPIRRGIKVCYENGFEDVFKVQHKHPWGDLPVRNILFLYKDKDEDENEDEDNWVALVLVISEGGSLMSFNPKGRMNVLTVNGNSFFDDVFNFKGHVYVIDRAGKLYSIDVYDEDDEANIGNWIAEGLCEGQSTNNRKRLTTFSGELHMINRFGNKFVVYKLNVGLRKWDEVNSLDDWIVLVTLDDVFVVDAGEFPGCRGDCILFAKHCFPDYLGRDEFEQMLFDGEDKYPEIGVFYVGGDDRACHISRYPELCDMLAPFPSWICSNASKNIVEVMNFVPQNHEIGSSSKTRLATCGEGSNKSVPEIIDLDLIPDEDVEKFEGVYVSSCFVPILQEVNDKHGKILQGAVHEVQSDSPLLKCCLETVAQMVKILQSNSGKCLADCDAKFLESSLLDLQFGRFNPEVVEWLVPLVKRALDHYHANKEENNKGLKTLKELEDLKLQMLDALRQVTEKVEEQKKIVAHIKKERNESI